MSKKISDWFTTRRERQVLENVNRHLGLSQDCVIELERMVDAASTGDLEGKKGSYQRLSQMETDADELRRTLSEEFLTKGSLPTDLREDLMELVRTMDWVADWSKEAGRLLNLLPYDRVPEPLKLGARKMASELIQCVLTLRKSINALATDTTAALRLAYEVERSEERIDDLYNEVRSQFLNLDSAYFQVPFLILLNMFFDALEMVSDWCENTSDLVRVLCVRFQGQ